ncbi:HDOD domain-containing protein [Candidatus Sumerlaeota bacterium]|nr:HDOD domain-containing protein [Candidatus Sumerlaeota bacterium]
MSDYIDTLLAQLDIIPPMPETSVRLTQLLSDSSSASMEEIASTIQYDPSLTVELLKICNSAYFSFDPKVTTVKDAIKRLGTNKIFQMVMATSSRKALDRELNGYGMPLGALWSQSILCGAASKKINLALREGHPDIAFTCGLLADIGKVAMHQLVHQNREQLFGGLKQGNAPYDQIEAQFFGINHAELGSRLAERWKMPPAIIDAIRYHHNPAHAPEETRPIVECVYLGSILAMQAGLGLGHDGMYYSGPDDIDNTYGLNSSDIENISSQTLEEFFEIKTLFGQ